MSLTTPHLLELFVDCYFIEKKKRLRQCLQEPLDCGPVFYFSEPWEGLLSGYCTVLEDPLDGFFKLYYRGLSDGILECSDGEVTCLALSHNGLDWFRPNLGIHKWLNRKSTNIILANNTPDSHNFTPFLDSSPTTLSHQRYKALAGVAPSGLNAYFSADGINWTKPYCKPVLTTGMFDSQNVAFWSSSEQTYVCFMRTWTGEGFSGIRTISRSTSTDFYSWTVPRRMSFGRIPLEHLYTNQTQPYPRAQQIYIGLAARFMPERQVITTEEALELGVDPSYYRDCSDVVLITSRGGNRYHRAVRQAILKPGIGLENWVSRTNFPALGFIRTKPDEISFYMNKNYAQPNAYLSRFSFPLDRLGYLEASDSYGELITKPIPISSQDDLHLNLSTSAAGSCFVALLDEDDATVSQFDMSSCFELIGNEFSKPVRWLSPTGVSLRIGDSGLSSVKLHIRLLDARLFAFSLCSTDC